MGWWGTISPFGLPPNPRATGMFPGVISSPTAKVNSERCVGCGRCIMVCPTQAISLGSNGKAVVNSALCRGCGACAAECPTGAIQIGQRAEAATKQV